MSSEHDDPHIEGDLELMLYADGELDEARAAEVAARVAKSPELQNKLAALRLGGAMVAKLADAGAGPAGSIADDVMRAIALEAGGAKVISLDEQRVARSKAGVDKAPIGAAPATSPANDNSRSPLVILTAIAVAVAAAFFLWGRSSPPDPVAGSSTTGGPAMTTTAPAPKAPSPEPTMVADREPEPGVEVTSVDFGSRVGSVFYVEGQEKGATTTVVWLSDDALGGD